MCWNHFQLKFMGTPIHPSLWVSIISNEKIHPSKSLIYSFLRVLLSSGKVFQPSKDISSESSCSSIHSEEWWNETRSTFLKDVCFKDDVNRLNNTLNSVIKNSRIKGILLFLTYLLKRRMKMANHFSKDECRSSKS